MQITLSQQHRDRRRARIDRLVRFAVTSSGLLVLMTLMLIFFYLLYSVWPLFRPVSVSLHAQLPIARSAPALAVGLDADQQFAYRIGSDGVGEFLPLATGKPPIAARLAIRPTLLAVSAGRNPLYALGQANGQGVLVRPDIPLIKQTSAQPGWQFPFGDQPLVFDRYGHALTHLALAEPTENKVILAAVTDDNRLIVTYLEPLQSPIYLVDEPLAERPDRLLLTPDGKTIYLLNGNILSVYVVQDPVQNIAQNVAQNLAQHDGLHNDQPGNTRISLRERVTLGKEPPHSLALLSGGNSLLVQEADGRISQWFDVANHQQRHLQRIRYLEHAEGGPSLLATETARRVFASLSANGHFSLDSSLQPTPLLNKTLVPGVTNMAFAPHGDGLLLENAQGLHWYHVTNLYPDISWRTLWQKVWYENYPQPEFVWQSTSGSDNYQAKLSLIPVIYGTLKAAFCAMLFAAPLALAGAIYTAWFMSPGLRRVVKPAVEVMGALPTVVIGLIAGVWLAPVLERYLSGFLLLPWLLAGVTLLCSAICARASITRRMRSAGWEVVLLLPVLLLTVWLTFYLGSWIEQAVLGEPLHIWLGADYDQRNALLVGIAMGFALIPIIFTLSEDALFSVPPALSQGSLALGATQWQTMVRVILPCASAGIFSALMIGFGRAVGETMIVLMATGNTPIVDGSLFQGLRALAANIAIEMPEAVAGSGHYRVLMLTALVLFIFTFVLNTLAEVVRQRLRARYSQQQGEL
ncbi:ABC transporter permease subunit [Edaphovirga cremea]|uniref:ABC transporter permease subunit n=1 Tax=Edaphovirga cremea TaxID=2267246 RepID=UPI0014738FE1|nr:ABC transporter permease subunit [Edaphovirga cremea]